MDGKQNIYYAMGILSYAVAKADGKVHDEERKKLFEIVEKGIDHTINFEYSEIIFQLLERDEKGVEGAYKWALAEFERSRHYLTNDLKTKMIDVIIQIADAFNNISIEESTLIERFQNDIKNIGSEHSLE